MSEQPNLSITDLSATQAGLVTRTQVLDCGLRPKFIAAQLSAGRWQRVHVGVFATFTGPLSDDARIWAAILRAGPGAVASHQTAAFLDGLADSLDETIHVTVAADRHVRSRIKGVRVHYAHRLDSSRHPAKSTPRTRVEDTVLDLVDVTRSAADVESWVTRAIQRRRTNPTRLAESLTGRKKIRWRAMLESMLVDVASGAETPLELRYLRAVERAHGLPTGDRQVRVAGARVVWVDVDLDAFDLRIELDGRLGHVEEGAFRDRRRDNRATLGGKATLRYGHADVFGDPCSVAGEVSDVLRARGWTGKARPCGPNCPLR